MCGRLVVPRKSKILSSFSLDAVGKFAPEIPSEEEHHPGDIVPVIVLKDSKKILTGMKWGFGEVYNTRVESLDKLFWRDAYENHRAIFPIERFFERRWFSEKDNLLAGAAIWRYRTYRGMKIREVSLLTQPSTEVVSKHHPRMPLLIPKKEIVSWMSKDKSAKDFTGVDELEIEYI